MLIDSHVHVVSRRYAAEEPVVGPDALIADAAAAGVRGMLGIGVVPAEWEAYKALCARYRGEPLAMWMAAGLHPNHAGEAEVTAQMLTALGDATVWPHVVALGECGLDYHYGVGEDVRAAQRVLFEAHCKAAEATGLPLVIHTREAEADTMAMLDGHDVRFVLHCFTGSEAMARWAWEKGQVISFSGVVTFKKSEALREIVKMAPEGGFLVETDAPYLAPEPMRSKRNAPALLPHTVDGVARVRGVEATEIACQTGRAFAKLFDRAMMPA